MQPEEIPGLICRPVETAEEFAAAVDLHARVYTERGIVSSVDDDFLHDRWVDSSIYFAAFHHGEVVGTSRLTWNPTPLTTFTFGATGSLGETTTAGASAIQNVTLNGGVTHRLRRNLTATGGASVTFADYLGIRRLDETYQVDLGLAYAIGRHIELVGNYQFNRVDSTIPSQEYTENQITAGVRFRL